MSREMGRFAGSADDVTVRMANDELWGERRRRLAAAGQSWLRPTVLRPHPWLERCCNRATESLVVEPRRLRRLRRFPLLGGDGDSLPCGGSGPNVLAVKLLAVGGAGWAAA